jgi:hypothetical protein
VCLMSTLSYSRCRSKILKRIRRWPVQLEKFGRNSERSPMWNASLMKDDEIVAFSWIVYESREQRDAVNAKVMADPRIQRVMSTLPFDGKRLIYGGFETFLEL